MRDCLKRVDVLPLGSGALAGTAFPIDRQALAGELAGFTGVDPDAPYEAPENPELVVDTMVETPEESLQHVLRTLTTLGYLESDQPMIEGDRVHSGMTDLRVHGTGHVVKEH